MPATHQAAPHKPRIAPKASRTPALASPDLADLQRLTIKEVQALAGRSETSLRDLIAAGRFPPADYRDGPRCVRWSAGLVRRWLQATTSQS
jgi:predicted DNA-binding transcriptional regulator AlpA